MYSTIHSIIMFKLILIPIFHTIKDKKIDIT